MAHDMTRHLERISQTQLMMGMFFFVFGSHGFLMSPLIEKGSYAAGAGMLLANVIGGVIVWAAVILCRSLPSTSFIDDGHLVLGKWLHYLFMAYLGFFFFHLAAFYVRQFNDFIVQTFLPGTPNAMIAFLITFIIVVAVRAGIEPIFRFAQVFFLFTIFSSLIIPFLLGKDLNFDMSIAFVTHVIKPVLLQSAMYTTPWYADMVVIVFFYHALARQQKTIKSVFVGSLLTTFVFLPFTINIIMRFGPHFSAEMTYSGHELLRSISVADFLENVDPFFISLWFYAVVIKVCICFYSATLVAAKVCGLRDYRVLVPAMGFFLFGFSMHMSENASEVYHFLLESWVGYAWIVVLIPVLYLVVAKLRGINQETIHNENY
jgi:spore germination protein KB